MAKDRRKDSTQPTRNGPSRRGGSSIRNDEAYIRETKSRLGDEQALRDHEARHQPGAKNPCSLKKSCHQYLLWLILELLKIYETAALVGPDLRELATAVTEQGSGADRCVTILDRLISRAGPDRGLQIVRDFFDHRRQSIEEITPLLWGSMSDPVYEILAEQPLQRFRELATAVLGSAGYLPGNR